MSSDFVLTIVTINFNNAAGLAKTFESLYGRLSDSVEIVVIDGYSSDGSRSVIEAHSVNLNFTRIVSEADSGIYDAMNKGLALASGDYVAFLNSGDVLLDFDVTSFLTSVRSSRLDGYYSNVFFLDNFGNVVRKWLVGPVSNFKIYLGWIPPHPMFAIKRDILIGLGGFDCSFKIAADYDLILRCFMISNLKAASLKNCTVGMENGGVSNGSLSGIVRSNIEVLASWRRLKGFIPIWIFFTKPLYKLSQIKLRSFWRFF